MLPQSAHVCCWGKTGPSSDTPINGHFALEGDHRDRLLHFADKKPLQARDAGGDCVAVAPHQFKFLKDFRNYFDAQ